MKEFETTLKNAALELKIDIDDKQTEKFKAYFNFLLEYNKLVNLTAITDPKEVAIKHFIDSLILSKFIETKKEIKFIDVGAGAGFPSVPNKILYPALNLTLLDSSNKRVKFLMDLTAKLGLNCEILHNRAEEIAIKNEYREKFDYVVARAVAPLNILAEYCLPFLKVGGIFLAMKGPSGADELKNASNALEILGGNLEKNEKFELPYNFGTRNILIIKKIKLTDLKYPRRSAKITKTPL